MEPVEPVCVGVCVPLLCPSRWKDKSLIHTTILQRQQRADDDDTMDNDSQIDDNDDKLSV